MLKTISYSILALMVILILLAGFSGFSYNSIMAKDESVITAWGDVESAYQRRMDLIPKLMEVVNLSASHEKETLTAVTEARAKVGRIKLNKDIINDFNSFNEFQTTQNDLSSALSRLLLVIENYPNLKANQNFRDLLYQLEGTENRIYVARTRYNEDVRRFNTVIRTFPGNIVNRFLVQLQRREPFKAKGKQTAAGLFQR